MASDLSTLKRSRSPTIVEEEVVGVKKLVKWSYGIGEEGRKVVCGQTGQVLIIDSLFPCWMSAAKAVGLSTSKIWLTQPSVFASKYLNEFAGNVSIECGPVATASVMLAACVSEWILVGAGFPSCLNTKDVWSSASLQGIVTTSGLNFKPPENWNVSTYVLRHSEVGGVTDGTFKFVVVSKQALGSRIRYDMTPSQDLRSILKSGGVGSRTMNLSLPGPRDAVSSVVYCGKGVVEEASLWPLGKKGVKVKTRWRSTFWIERELVSMEMLLALDVSEKLIRSIPEGQDRTLLIRAVHTPGKVLFATLSYVFRRSSGKSSSLKRKGEEQGSGESLKRRTIDAQPGLPDWIAESSNEISSKVGNHRVLLSPKCLRDLTIRLSSMSDDDEVTPAIRADSSVTGSTTKIGDAVKLRGDPNVKATKSDGAAVRVE